MRGNDNKWGGMKMAFGKWEKKWKYDYAGREIKRSYHEMLQRNGNAWSKINMK